LINFAEKVLKLEDPNSEEIDPNAKNLVVIYLPDIAKDVYGGTLRKGAKITKIL
jgi:CTP synthase (UTP-ammonia lyase)